ncbi:hypothetical protein TNCV_4326111 [Trichonephila clavipes]|nr:hypothetical protein TNCV_4326111 [Trichonephila clavipes]
MHQRHCSHILVLHESCYFPPKSYKKKYVVLISRSDSHGADLAMVTTNSYTNDKGCGSPVVKVSDHGRHVMSLNPVPLKTCCAGQRCMLNLSRAETSSRWSGSSNSDVAHIT